jgi:hypothetical protein
MDKLGVPVWCDSVLAGRLQTVRQKQADEQLLLVWF